MGSDDPNDVVVFREPDLRTSSGNNCKYEQTQPWSAGGEDAFGRVSTITCAAGEAALAVTQEYDSYGHMLAARDSATKLADWKLTGVDDAGRFQREAFGNDVATTHTIVTQAGATTIQSLAYEYDARLDLASRTDALQPQNKTERFRYDPLERLTCAYFSPVMNDTAPCALSYHDAPSGNLTLAYGDPQHPHAVTSAGSDTFGYDATGNQIARPSGTVVTYTPFDLPKSITQSSGTVTFGYDGDEQRIRKTTPEEETIYFSGLYERGADARIGALDPEIPRMASACLGSPRICADMPAGAA